MPVRGHEVEYETALSLIKRVKGCESVGAIPNLECLQADLRDYCFREGDIVELNGASGSGKSEILFGIIANFILPREWGGLQKGAVFVDVDYKFDILRIVNIVRFLVVQREYSLKGQGVNACVLKNIVQQSLQRLYVVRPESPNHLVMCLYRLAYFFNERSTFKVLALDSISASYWIDKAEALDNFNDQGQRVKQMARVIKNIADECRVLFICSKAELFATSYDRKNNRYSNAKRSSEFLCKSWQDIVTYRFLLQREDGAECREKLVGKGTLFSATLTSKFPQPKRFFKIDHAGISTLSKGAIA
eukprot:Nk52_evm71s230 gene=Nk52_evmTU71s230